MSPSQPERIPLDGRMACLKFSVADDGDFQVADPAVDLDDRRRAVIDIPWSWLRQVHGSRVVEVTTPGDYAGEAGDGLATASTGAPISVTTADCAPVVLVAERGVAVLHAGWRGLLEGIVAEGASLLERIAGGPVATRLGPCIHPLAYEFGSAELAMMVDRFGTTVASQTVDHRPALDMPEAVAVACEQAGYPRPDVPPCTSSPNYFSHRTRTDRGRQVAVTWLENTNDGAF